MDMVIIQLAVDSGCKEDAAAIAAAVEQEGSTAAKRVCDPPVLPAHLAFTHLGR